MTERRRRMRRVFCGSAIVGLALGAGGMACSGDAVEVENPAAPRPVAVGKAELTAAGGTFIVGDLVLEVPAGAVATPVTVEITSTSAGVAGYRVVGKVYTLAPTELRFLQPITVSLPGSTEDGSRVHWSIAGDGARFEALPTTFDAKHASVVTAHLGRAFVGAAALLTETDGGDTDAGDFDAGYDGEADTGDTGGDSDAGYDGGEADAGDTDAGYDGGEADAGDTDAGTDAGTSCTVTPAIDPLSKPDVYESLPRTATCGLPDKTVRGHVFELTQETNVTSYVNHRTGPQAFTKVELRQGCGATAPVIANYAYSTGARTNTLPAGIYTFVTCESGYGNFVTTKTPTLPNENTSCETAREFTAGAAPHRSYGGEVLYYTWTASSTRQYVYVTNAAGQPGQYMFAGNYRFELRTACNDPASAFYDTDDLEAPGGTASSTGFPNGRTYLVGQLTAGQRYWLVLRRADEGLKLAFQWQ